MALCDIAPELTGHLEQFQTGGLFDDGRTVAAFLPALSSIHAVRANAARGLILVSPFYWDQNDQTRSFAGRFIPDTDQMPDAAPAAAYAAVRHYLRTAIVTEALDAARINQEMHRMPAYFFGRSASLRPDGRPDGRTDGDRFVFTAGQAGRGDACGMGSLPADQCHSGGGY